MAEQQAIASPGQVAEYAGRYLSFALHGEIYGISILRVREIIGMQPITRVPGSRHFIKGVINLRGKVIPVVELRRRFEMEEATYTEETCIIIVDFSGNLTGFIVDAVAEVVNLVPEAIEPAPRFGSEVDGLISAVGKVGTKIIMLLDVDQALRKEENNLILKETA